MNGIPTGVLALVANDDAGPAVKTDPNLRLRELEVRIMGLIKLVEAFAEKQDIVNDDIRDTLDRVYRVLDQTTDETEV